MAEKVKEKEKVKKEVDGELAILGVDTANPGYRIIRWADNVINSEIQEPVPLNWSEKEILKYVTKKLTPAPKKQKIKGTVEVEVGG